VLPIHIENTPLWRPEQCEAFAQLRKHEPQKARTACQLSTPLFAAIAAVFRPFARKAVGTLSA
jgi:hypothetical protein